MKRKAINRIAFSLALATTAAFMLTGCADDYVYDLSGEGNLRLTATLNSDVKVVSRTDADELRELYGETLELWITKPGSGPVRRYQGINNLPNDNIVIPAGSYVAEAWAGDSVPASFDKKYFKAYVPFSVVKGNTTNLDVTLKIANVVVTVDYDQTALDVLKEYKMTVSHARGSLEYEAGEDRSGYFMMPTVADGQAPLLLTLTGKTYDGKPYTQTDTITDPMGGYKYCVHVKFNGSAPDAIGAGNLFDISVDTSEIEVEDSIEITLAPDIKGIGFDIAQPQTGEPGNIGRKSVYITGADPLTSLVFESEALRPILGYARFDVILATDPTIRTTLQDAGIVIMEYRDAENNLTNVRINFEPSFTNALAVGTHTFTFTAYAGTLSSQATMTLDVTEAPAVILPVEESAIDYTSVTLRANLVGRQAIRSRDGEVMGFNIRKVGESGWLFVEGQAEGNVLTAKVTGLTHNTTYEYVVVVGTFTSLSPMTFKTKSYPQIPNSDFEVWNKVGKNYLAAESMETRYWDSGNHGATTLGDQWNITVPDATIKHSGKYSAKMTSKYIVMQFAAGNIFTGEFLGTDGTNGILGFGRPFTAPARPKALKGYYKYRPSKINRGSADGAVKGANDQCAIYIALLSDHTVTYDGKAWPFVIKTKTKELFDPNAANVISYGALMSDQPTPGEDLVEFTIDLTDVNPMLEVTNILVVASSSRWGDYFCGGDDSTLWIDDLELIY